MRKEGNRLASTISLSTYLSSVSYCFLPVQRAEARLVVHQSVNLSCGEGNKRGEKKEVLMKKKNMKIFLIKKRKKKTVPTQSTSYYN